MPLIPLIPAKYTPDTMRAEQSDLDNALAYLPSKYSDSHVSFEVTIIPDDTAAARLLKGDGYLATNFR